MQHIGGWDVMAFPRKKHIWVASTMLACPLLLIAPTAQAAEEPEADHAALEQIVVTAEKRPASLQKTPISISVMGANDLVNRHVQSLSDLMGGTIPSLRVLPYASRPFSLILNIRGIGVMQDTNQPALDSGVGVYIDGVYLGRPQGLSAALYDVESIEVLKGPQGTLFGRNTIGGALHIVTKKPTGRFGLDLTTGIGNYGSYKIEGHLNLAESHNFSVKVDGIITARDGLVDNPMPGAADFNAWDRRGLHTQVQWKPGADFTANYTFDTAKDSSTTIYRQVIEQGTFNRPPLLAVQPGRASEASVGVPMQPSIGTQTGHALNLSWVASPKLTVKSITSYRELAQSQFDNSNLTSVSANFIPGAAASTPFARYSLANFDQYQYSQEFQLIGETGRLRYVVGALGYYESVRDFAQTVNSMSLNSDGTVATVVAIPTAKVAIIDNALVPGLSVDRASKASTESYGAFGQFTYTPALLDDILHLTLGGRWTNDRKKGTLQVVNNALPSDPDDPTGKAKRLLDFRRSWSRFDPMINLSVDITPDVHAYGKWSTGYRSGGANSRSLTYAAVNPEEVSIFEGGIKTEFFDRRARFNVTGYFGTYKNVQMEFSGPYYNLDASGNPIGVTTRTTSDTVNVPGTGRVSGIEAELNLALAKGLTLSANYAYVRVNLPDARNPFPTYTPGVGMVYNPPLPASQIYTPMHALGGQIDYERPLGNITLRTHLDASWDSGAYGSLTYSGASQKIKSESAVVFNGRIGIGDIAVGTSGAALTVSFWARNLFNAQYLYSRSLSTTTGLSGIYNEARTFGVEARIRL